MQQLKLGLKQGLAKGIAIGGNGSVSFALWAFISWYGSTLVMNHDVSGGKIFGVGYCIILGGL
jgi:ATP-binding cassette subfamily B (MDR/TAP) protein 1